MIIDAAGPGAPSTSSTRAVMRVSPGGKAISAPTPVVVQYCAREVEKMNVASCEALRVQASPLLPR